MSESDKTENLEAAMPETPEPAGEPAKTAPRAWSTRTLAASAVAALVIGAGGGAALGAVSGGDDSRGGPGRGGMRQFPGGQQDGRQNGQLPNRQDGQLPQGGPQGTAPQQQTPPSTPPDPQSGTTGVPSDGASL